MLPPMARARPAGRASAVTADQHFTQPPPRYSEASLVKKMEELGIGRPSTYAEHPDRAAGPQLRPASRSKRFMPEDRGRLVTAFLTSFFERYVDTGFTASLEEQLDDISGGKADWRAGDAARSGSEFSRAVEQTRDLKITDVIDALDQELGPHFFPPATTAATRATARPAARAGSASSSAGTAASSAARTTRPANTRGALAIENGEDTGETLKEGKRDLGHHPETGEQVTVRRGPYGLYVQQGEAGRMTRSASRAAPRCRAGWTASR